MKLSLCCTILFAIVYMPRPITHGCGVSTHISIAHEASFYMKKSNYADIVRKNQDAFVAGNPYPDFAYAKECLNYKYHAVSETTHWAPFLNATINYIRRNYKQPWNAYAQKLIAFTFGFVSHQVADISWHSLGIDQGFIRAMANVNFHAVFNDAHGTADTGGDMISQLEGDDSVINQYQWFIPSKDLYNIYKEFYGEERIQIDVIEECTTLLFLAWLGEKIAGAKLFKEYAKKSPFLEEKLQNYFLGGKHDMASWTNEIWDRTEVMMEQGTQACQVPKNTLFINCTKGNSAKHLGVVKSKNDLMLRNPGRPYLTVKHNLTSHDVTRVRTGNGFNLYPNSEVIDMIEKSRKENLDESKGILAKYKVGRMMNIRSPSLPAMLYAELGSSMIHANGLPIGPTLIIGAPNYNYAGNAQLGRVFLVNTTTSKHENDISDMQLEDMNYDIIDGPDRMTKFGWSVAVVDLNKDGVDDLAIGAPSKGASDLKYHGAVYIYFGKKGHKYSKSPDMVISGNTTFENFGYTLNAADFNNDGFKDLVIGSPFAAMGGPQRGRVDVVFAMQNPKEIKREMIAMGTQDYEWFGYSLDFARVNDKAFLFVGAPAYRKCANTDCSYSVKDIQEKGKVFIYDVTSLSILTLRATLEGPSSFSKFGASLAFGFPFGTKSSPMLAVSASSLDVQGHLIDMVPNTFIQAGRVYLLNFTKIFEKGIRNEDIHKSEAVITTFSGDRSFARFGMIIDFKDSNHDSIDDLVIGSPFRTKDLTEEITGAESGAIYIFYGGKSFPVGDATGNCGYTSVEPCPELKASKSYEGQENNARFGSSFAISKDRILIGSPRSSHYGFHSGNVQFANTK